MVTASTPPDLWHPRHRRHAAGHWRCVTTSRLRRPPSWSSPRHLLHPSATRAVVPGIVERGAEVVLVVRVRRRVGCAPRRLPTPGWNWLTSIVPDPRPPACSNGTGCGCLLRSPLGRACRGDRRARRPPHPGAPVMGNRIIHRHKLSITSGSGGHQEPKRRNPGHDERYAHRRRPLDRVMRRKLAGELSNTESTRHTRRSIAAAIRAERRVPR